MKNATIKEPFLYNHTPNQDSLSYYVPIISSYINLISLKSSVIVQPVAITQQTIIDSMMCNNGYRPEGIFDGYMNFFMESMTKVYMIMVRENREKLSTSHLNRFCMSIRYETVMPMFCNANTTIVTILAIIKLTTKIL